MPYYIQQTDPANKIGNFHGEYGGKNKYLVLVSLSFIDMRNCKTLSSENR